MLVDVQWRCYITSVMGEKGREERGREGGVKGKEMNGEGREAVCVAEVEVEGGVTTGSCRNEYIGRVKHRSWQLVHLIEHGRGQI